MRYSPIVDLVHSCGSVWGNLGSVALLEEAHYWRLALRVQRVVPFLVHV